MKPNSMFIAAILGILYFKGAAQGQYTLKQVIILNEGKFGGPATIASYDPSTKTYSVFDTIYARFASDVIIDSGYIYAAVDTFLIKYDLNTKQKILSKVVHGVRKLAIWKNQLLVTRAEISPLPTYFQVYDKNTFSLIYELSLTERAEGVKVMNDTAYVAINGWGTVGKLGIIDLNLQGAWVEIDLGPDGLNPEPVFVSKINGKVYTQNNLNWTDASVAIYNPSNGSVTTKKFMRNSGCIASEYYLNNIYFQISGENKIGVFNLNSLSIWDSLEIGKQIYAMGIDSINGRIYVSETDYTTYGKIFIYDFYGNKVDSFNAGITPGYFAFDVRKITGVDDIHSPYGYLFVEYFPQYQKIIIYIPSEIPQNTSSLTVNVIDVMGRKIIDAKTPPNNFLNFDVSKFSNGLYTVILGDGNSLRKASFVKY